MKTVTTSRANQKMAWVRWRQHKLNLLVHWKLSPPMAKKDSSVVVILSPHWVNVILFSWFMEFVLCHKFILGPISGINAPWQLDWATKNPNIFDCGFEISPASQQHNWVSTLGNREIPRGFCCFRRGFCELGVQLSNMVWFQMSLIYSDILVLTLIKFPGFPQLNIDTQFLIWSPWSQDSKDWSLELSYACFRKLTSAFSVAHRTPSAGGGSTLKSNVLIFLQKNVWIFLPVGYMKTTALIATLYSNTGKFNCMRIDHQHRGYFLSLRKAWDVGKSK